MTFGRFLCSYSHDCPLPLCSLASQPLFLRGGARGGGREKESGDLSQHFVFSAGMWVEPMRLQQSHDFHSVIQRQCVRLPSLQNATRLSKVVPQARISSEELLQRTGCTRESSNGYWKIALLLRIYTAEGFSVAHLPTVTTLQSFASPLQLDSQLHI